MESNSKVSIILLQQILFALFLVSNSISEIFRTTFYPGTIIIPCMFLLFLLGILKFNTESYIVKKNEMILISLFVIISLYSFLCCIIRNNFDSIIKSMDLVLIFMFYFIGKDLSRKESKLIGSIVVTFTIIHSLLLLCDYSVFYLDRKINYLLITMSISYGAIVSMVKLFETSVKLIYRIFFFIIMVLSICAISRTHSRVNFLVLVLFFMFLFIRKNATRKNIKYLIILVLLLFVTFSPIINYLMENSLVVKRIMSYSVSNYEHSRQQIFDTLISGFDTFKYIGFGTGGTETFLMSRINQPYPHNLFLEFYTEYGILGAIFSLYLFYFISRLLLFKVDWHNYSEKLYALILVFLLLLYMKSFSLYNAYPIFLFIGLLVNLSNTRIQKPIKKSIYG